MTTHSLSLLPIPPSTTVPRRSIHLSPPPLLSSPFTTSPIRPFTSLSSQLHLHRPNRSSVYSSVYCSLPTKKFSSQKIPKWSARAIRSFGLGELEARKLKYPNTGTEALLMGILIEGTSEAAKFLRANGITFLKVREETVNLLGKSDMFFFSPEHPPLTEQAQRAIDSAIEQTLKSGKDGEITTTHIVLAIWSDPESAGHNILETLGFNDDKAKELSKSMNEDIALVS